MKNQTSAHFLKKFTKNFTERFGKMKEKGIFRGQHESDFATDSSIRRELAIKGETKALEYASGLPVKRNLNDYINSAEKRNKEYNSFKETAENPIKIKLPDTSIVSVIGDLHFNHPETDLERFRREIEVIRNTPNSYIILGGDLVDGIFWGGERENNFNLNEEFGFMYSLFEELKGKVLFGVSGEHDSKWRAKTGGDIYEIFTGITGAPYVKGIAEAEVDIKGIDYKIVAAHKMLGRSMYNKNHPTMRQSRFGLQGGDVYISCHTHKKQI